MRYKNIALIGGALVAVIVVIMVVRFWMPDEPTDQIGKMSGENLESEVLSACFSTRPKIINISLSGVKALLDGLENEIQADQTASEDQRRVGPMRPTTRRSIWPQGGVGGGLSLFHGPQERRRRLGQKNARRLARQSEKVGPRKPHAFSRIEKGEAPGGCYCLS